MKACLLFGLTLSVANGCTSSYDVANEPAPDKYSFAQVNEDAKDQSFTISTIHGKRIGATDLFVRGDSTSFLEPSVTSRSTIATSSVETITFHNHWVGGLEGFGYGFIPGAVLGFVGSDLFQDSDPSFSWYEGVAFFGVITGIPCGLVGLWAGHKYEYQFVNNADSTKK